MANPVCKCGHVRETHEHYRRGTDCAVCGPELCPRFRRSFFGRVFTPPTRPAGGADVQMAASPSTPVVTGPLAIVSDFRAYTARRLSAG